jgi:predicted aspartyl protease
LSARRGSGAVAAGLAAALLAAAAHAEPADCAPRLVGSAALRWDGLRPTLAGSIDGQPVDMSVDTGALGTVVSGRLAARLRLSRQRIDAEQVGFGGVSAAAGARLAELSLGGLRWRDVGVAVPERMAEELPDVLVGAGLLFERDVELDGQAIRFFEPPDAFEDCLDRHPAGWAGGAPWVATQAMGPGDPRVTVPVVVDGIALRALVDSGSPLSMLDVSVARRLGFDPDRPGTPSGRGGGVGAHLNTQWVGAFRAVVIGPEEVRQVALAVADLWGRGAADLAQLGRVAGAAPAPLQMILGADFLKAHRVLFAASQRRLYFAFAGGRVFQAMSMTRPAPAAPAVSGVD